MFDIHLWMGVVKQSGEIEKGWICGIIEKSVPHFSPLSTLPIYMIFYMDECILMSAIYIYIYIKPKCSKLTTRGEEGRWSGVVLITWLGRLFALNMATFLDGLILSYQMWIIYMLVEITHLCCENWFCDRQYFMIVVQVEEYFHFNSKAETSRDLAVLGYPAPIRSSTQVLV